MLVRRRIDDECWLLLMKDTLVELLVPPFVTVMLMGSRILMIMICCSCSDSSYLGGVGVR